MFNTLLSNNFIALWFNTMFNIFIKASIVLIVPLIINLIHKKSAAEFRHLLLFISISILILLPFLPGPILTFEFPAFQQELNHPNDGLSGTNATISNSAFSDFDSTIASGDLSNTLTFLSINNNPGINRYLAIFTFITWLAGSIYLVAHLLMSIIAVFRIKKSLRSFSDQEWGKTLANFCGELKLNRPIQLLNGDKFQTPFTFGIIRPFIYLPYSSKYYSTEQRRCILLHELSHLKRGDTFTYLIARFIVALYWFNPLAWLALRLLRFEQEKACDDRVLNYGIKPSDYAFLLLHFFKERRPAHPVAALGVSSFKIIKSRIDQILNPIQKHNLLNTKMCITAMTIVAFLTVIVAAFGPAATATEGSMISPITKQAESFQAKPLEQPDKPTTAALKTVADHETALKSDSPLGNHEPKTGASTASASDIPSLIPLNGNVTTFFDKGNTQVNPQDETDVSQPQAKPVASDPNFVKPVPFTKVSSPFGQGIDSITKTSRFHSGIDIPLPIETPVRAAADGKVIKAEFAGGYGLMVAIAHQDEISTVYAHLSSLSVKQEQIILQGDILGYSGDTGRTTGPHLHYEVRVKGKPVNPLIFIKQDNIQVNSENESDEKTGSLSLENPTASDPNFMKPVPFNKISSPFGLGTDPITKTSRFHSGIDIPLPVGTPVKASADGQVVKAESSGVSGILVIIAHQNNYSTYYAKLSQALIKVGDTVKQGDIIAYSGNTGRSTGPHLHFEVREQGRPVDPMLFLTI